MTDYIAIQCGEEQRRRQIKADHVISRKVAGKYFRFIVYFDPLHTFPSMRHLRIADPVSGYKIIDVHGRMGMVTLRSLDKGYAYRVTRSECWELARERLDDLIARVGEEAFRAKIEGAPIHPVLED